MNKEKGFFDEDERLVRLSSLGDNLEKLNKVIDWEIFRPILSEVFEKEAKGRGGRPPFDVIMMFKIIVLQRIYNISDDQMEFQLNDRLTFMRFIGLSLSDKIPDSKTIWHFRNMLVKAKVERKLFKRFNKILENMNITQKEGRIIDATFVESPRQHNSRDENATIKNGNIPESWKKDDQATINKVRQKDVDARWTQKGGQRHYGYKNHVKADVSSKIIVDYTVTNAAVHDSKELEMLVNENDKVIYADSAYVGQDDKIPKNVKMVVCERCYRNKPLSDLQKQCNRIKSKIRCRIEHIFGFMTNSLHGLTVRTIGIARATFNIGLTNLIYNMFRFTFLKART